MSRRRLVAAALAALTVVLAPSAASAAPAAQPDTKLMVLRLPDMPTGFGRESGHYVSNAQQAATTTPRRDFDKLGRVIGYSATYTKDGIVGLLQVESDANLYRSASLAHASFLSGLKSIEATKTYVFKQLAVGTRLGHEARLYKATTNQNGTKVDVYALAWRSGSVISTVLGAGIAGTVDPADLVALGRKQQARINAATR